MEMNPKPGLILNSYDLLQVVMMKMCGYDVCVIFVWRLDFFVCVWWSRHLPSGGETSLKLPLFLMMIKSNNKKENFFNSTLQHYRQCPSEKLYQYDPGE